MTDAPGSSSADAVGVVLLVDDEETVRWLAARALRRLGYAVVEAVNGAEALRILREQGGAIRLLLTDMVMPGMSGWELAEVARVERPELPVLFMSGFPHEWRSLGGRVGFILKPFAPDDLAAEVRELLD